MKTQAIRVLITGLVITSLIEEAAAEDDFFKVFLISTLVFIIENAAQLGIEKLASIRSSQYSFINTAAPGSQSTYNSAEPPLSRS